jgi:hypothetical protein
MWPLYPNSIVLYNWEDSSMCDDEGEKKDFLLQSNYKQILEQ